MPIMDLIEKRLQETERENRPPSPRGKAVFGLIVLFFVAIIASQSPDEAPTAKAVDADLSASEKARKSTDVDLAKAAEDNRLAGMRDEVKRENFTTPIHRHAELVSLEEFRKSCLTDVDCAAGQMRGVAHTKCRPHIENLARYEVKWTYGIYEHYFDKHVWKDRKAGLITFVGDVVKFQNIHGTWENMIYECDFDVHAEKVLEVRALPGRF